MHTPAELTHAIRHGRRFQMNLLIEQLWASEHQHMTIMSTSIDSLPQACTCLMGSSRWNNISLRTPIGMHLMLFHRQQSRSKTLRFAERLTMQHTSNANQAALLRLYGAQLCKGACGMHAARCTLMLRDVRQSTTELGPKAGCLKEKQTAAGLHLCVTTLKPLLKPETVHRHAAVHGPGT